ncbi:uncharacterized protein PGTG_04605 [Puccinia graminis f. sp. tritici CRL 75-36-700-3]|uniref:Uncharacterized protein n=1 Tax=Puccinia graminis f. sp. tritici (strain CRL 75-36-700-3 / race SCCL) TaxID=418459 RepID=E3K2T0_PUCGT|nr:uncharacterized protein PGTG_04605 [Puccinia graminis f. sp. tritici CRL 75-36-700-3]EFP78649.1 hypothetical protein PGTG_04605 [Puccinia graminis f. sp. tritici CRL 75-36-700-3]
MASQASLLGAKNHMLPSKIVFKQMSFHFKLHDMLKDVPLLTYCVLISGPALSEILRNIDSQRAQETAQDSSALSTLAGGCPCSGRVQLSKGSLKRYKYGVISPT